MKHTTCAAFQMCHIHSPPHGRGKNVALLYTVEVLKPAILLSSVDSTHTVTGSKNVAVVIIYNSLSVVDSVVDKQCCMLHCAIAWIIKRVKMSGVWTLMECVYVRL